MTADFESMEEIKDTLLPTLGYTSLDYLIQTKLKQLCVLPEVRFYLCQEMIFLLFRSMSRDLPYGQVVYNVAKPRGINARHYKELFIGE